MTVNTISNFKKLLSAFQLQETALHRIRHKCRIRGPQNKGQPEKWQFSLNSCNFVTLQPILIQKSVIYLNNVAKNMALFGFDFVLSGTPCR